MLRATNYFDVIASAWEESGLDEVIPNKRLLRASTQNPSLVLAMTAIILCKAS